MKPIYAITEEQALQEIKSNWLTTNPELQARIRTSAAELVEASQIAWRAGFQAGLASAVMTLKEKYHDEAKELMEAFKGEEIALPEQEAIPMVKTIKKEKIPQAH